MQPAARQGGGRFKSDALWVFGPASPSWYVLDQTLNAIDPSLIDLAREPFGGEDGDQAMTQARTDAGTWSVYRRAITYVTDQSHPFAKRVVVHNPADVTFNKESWTSTVTRTSTSTRVLRATWT